MFSPFRGLFFHPSLAGSSGEATCPPYDVIDDEARRRYLASSPYNVVRLLLPGREASYQEAGDLLRGWLAEGVVAEDPEPRFYLYRMGYRDGASRARQAQGVIGALQLEEPGRRVLAHEETMEHARADRLSVLRATRANLDPIVALTPVEGLEPLLEPEGPPRIAFRAEGVHHRLYDLGRAVSTTLAEAVSSRPLAIADGHHRYATALRYRREREAEDGTGPWSAILTFVSPARRGGLSVGAIHRVFERGQVDRAILEKAFVVSRHRPEPPEEPGHVVLVSRDGALLLRPTPDALEELPRPWRQAGSAVARELLYPLMGLDESQASYVPDPRSAVESSAPGGLAVLTSPIPARAISQAIEEGLRFPQKSTFFYPKPRAGLVMRLLG
ncbi:MAG: DUF1015 family protein [Acidimicrobiia bacterium]